jgi:hypothetical protein
MLASVCKCFVVRWRRQPAFLGISSPGDLIGLHTYARVRVRACLVLVQAHAACLQRRARATRRPARRWHRHGAAGWATLGAGGGLALATCLQSELWRTWRQRLARILLTPDYKRVKHQSPPPPSALLCSGFCSQLRAHTGARPSVRLFVGPELARCVHYLTKICFDLQRGLLARLELQIFRFETNKFKCRGSIRLFV